MAEFKIKNKELIQATINTYKKRVEGQLNSPNSHSFKPYAPKQCLTLQTKAEILEDRLIYLLNYMEKFKTSNEELTEEVLRFLNKEHDKLSYEIGQLRKYKVLYNNKRVVLYHKKFNKLLNKLKTGEFDIYGWRKIRNKVLKRDNYKCTKCSSAQFLEIHHIIYRSEGGSDDLENLETLCVYCHYNIHKDETVAKVMLARIQQLEGI